MAATDGLLVFVDESGYAQPRDASPWNTLVAIGLPESASRDLSRWLHSTVRAAYPHVDPQTYEIKAADLLNRRQFERSPERRRLVDEIRGVMTRLPLAIYAVRAPRPTTSPAWPRGQVDPPHRLLIERIELHMRAEHPGGFAKLIFDETAPGNDAARSRGLQRFMHATREGKCWAHIVDVPLFVSFAITPGIQLADLMAGVLRHHQILRAEGSTFTTDWERAILQLSEVATAASRDFPVRGETYYGLYTMPARYYANPPHPREF